MGESKKISKPKMLNAVDLITVVVFATLFRVLFYLFKLLGVIYPFNHTFLYLVNAFCLAACIVTVKKRYATVLYTVAWTAINFFIQGDIPLYFLCIIVLPLLPEIYFILQSKRYENPDDVFFNVKHIVVTTFMYNIVYFVFNFAAIIKVFLIPTPMNLIFIVFGISLICIYIGAWLGYKSGYKIKGLIG